MEESIKRAVLVKNGFGKAKKEVLWGGIGLLFCLAYFWENGGRASAAPLSHEIVITGEVSVSPEYLFVLREHSLITIAKEDGKIWVRGTLLGFQNVPQARRLLFFLVKDEAGMTLEETVVFTDPEGRLALSLRGDNAASVEMRIESKQTSLPLKVFVLADDLPQEASFLTALLRLLP